MATALFAGSFNPFTVGHASVVERALPLFDKIIIAVGVNAEKSDIGGHESLEEIKKYCRRFPDGKVEATTYSGELTIDLARRLKADCLLRGVRSVKDLEYERDMADINRRLSGIETLLMFALPEDAAISSSIVRELKNYGRDISQFLP